MGIIQFEVQHPTGQREAIRVEGERALIGSASYCDVRLPINEAAYEHVLVEVVGGTLRAEAKSDDPPATINGMPLAASTLPADAVLGVGRVRLVVTFIPDIGAAPELSESKRKESNPLTALLLVLLFVGAGALLWYEPDAEIAPPPTTSVELFAKAGAACPHTNPEQARAFARERVDMAANKRERLPFFVRDGVTAAELYDSAAACFRASGDEESARQASESALALKADLEHEFRARKLRLSHMLKVEDYELALRDVTVLLALTSGQRGPYIEWLTTVMQQLKAKGAQ